MRAKKLIMLIGDEAKLGPVKFVINSDPSYRAFRADDVREALTVMRASNFSLVIAQAEVANLSALLNRIVEMDRSIPKIVLCSRSTPFQDRNADAVLAAPPMAELLERIKVMSARKRGPKVGSVRAPRLVTA